ncbi:hypothetical protein BOX15_Mlig013669g1 [Macrostomum lignano]|nr:hypothetical protein BOX15_Mlig013669g1 [Macrostomum lignano]
MLSLAQCFISVARLPRLESQFQVSQCRVREEEGGSLVYRSEPTTLAGFVLLLLHRQRLAWLDCRELLESLADRGYRFHGNRVSDAGPLRCLHRLHPRRLDDGRPGVAETRICLVRRLLSWLLSNGWDGGGLSSGWDLQDCRHSDELHRLHAALSAAGVSPSSCDTCRCRRVASLSDLCCACVRRQLLKVSEMERPGFETGYGWRYEKAVRSLPLPLVLQQRCLDGGCLRTAALEKD